MAFQTLPDLLQQLGWEVSGKTALVCTGGIIALVAAILWQAHRDPLSHVPGPWLARITPLWLWWISFWGIECRVLEALHKKYGAAVRIGPNEVDIASGEAINAIYIKDGGYPKAPIYRNYDLEGFETIFSTGSPAHRALRAKAVAPLFAHQNVNKGKTAISNVIKRMVDELQRKKQESRSKPVDLINLFRAASLDGSMVYLCGESADSIGQDRCFASEFVDNFVGGGQFFNMPGWLYDLVHTWLARFDSEKAQNEKSQDLVQSFATKVVDRSRIAIEKGEKSDHTYQARLMAAGVSREETISQVMDIMFAVTDAPGNILSRICWYLVQHPEKYERAFQECCANPDVDARALPYLSGIVKEASRLSMANPTRLPRVVSAGGMSVPNLPYLPAGTQVGVGSYSLHFNSDVFPQARNFVPERWLKPTPDMLRDNFTFGAGTRSCLGQSLGTAQMWWATEAIIRSDVLRGAEIVTKTIDIQEWFNARIIGGKVEVQWP